MIKSFGHISNYKRGKGAEIFIMCLLILLIMSSEKALAYQYTITDYNQNTHANNTRSQKVLTPYIVIAENEDWIRPDPMTPGQAEAARHHIFDMPFGASQSVSFYTDLGLDERILYDPNPDYIRLMIINSRITSVNESENKIIVIAEPVSSGYQAISINKNDMPKDTILVCLMTTDGQEIDSLTLQRN
jgi:hypothetical protein